MRARKFLSQFGPVPRFLKDESGTVPLHLAWILLCFGIAGIAIDTSHALMVKNQMQVTADAAAHAAVLNLPDETGARTAAIEIAQTTMDPERFGNALVPTDIEFGTWNFDDKTFTLLPSVPDVASSANAARVTIRQQGGVSRQIQNFLLHMVGQDTFTIETQAIFVTDRGCLGNALMTDGKMDFDFNFSVTRGFCLYGTTYKMKESAKNGQDVMLELGSGAVVAAPESATLDALRQKTFTTDYVDIEAALLVVTYDVPYYNITNCLIQMYKDPTNPIQPPYIDAGAPVIHITSDMYVLPRIGEDPHNPNDGPGPFENTPVYTGGNGIANWSAVKRNIDACPENAGLAQTKEEGPYNDGLIDLPIVWAQSPPGRPSYPDDAGLNRVMVDPNDLKVGRVHYFDCPPAGGYVVFDSGVVLARMVLISECGFAFGGPKELANDLNDAETVNQVLFRTPQIGEEVPDGGVLRGDPSIPPVKRPYLHDVVLLTEGTHKNTIFAQNGLIAGAPDDCAPGGGVLMISNGSMRVHGYYDMNDVQAIAPNDIHWHQVVNALGGVTIAGTKIHAMRNWLSKYVGCTAGADLFLSTGTHALRLVR